MQKYSVDSLSHEQLEIVSENAEEFLYSKNVKLMSHSYENIILQAIAHGFEFQVDQ
jgi:hypothetical protein